MRENISGVPPESDDEILKNDGVIFQKDLDNEIEWRVRHAQGLADGDVEVRLRDKEGKRKAKIIGSAAAIGIAAGLLTAYFATQKHRKKKR